MTVRYMKSKDGAYQDVYDTGEQDRLEKIGWKLIQGTPFEDVQAERAKSKPATAGGSYSSVEGTVTMSNQATDATAVILPPKKKGGRPKKTP